jgi:hypothetical protein
MKKRRKMQILEIPQDIIDITKKCQWDLIEYAEFDLSIAIDKNGDIGVRDMIGVWDPDYATDRQPDVAWELIRKWWADEEENIAAKQTKRDIENQIAQLQKDLGTLESTAKKKKWFW